MSLIWKTARARRAEAEAERKAKLKEWEIETLVSGKRDAVLAETGVDLLAHSETFGEPVRHLSVDGGEGRDQEQVIFDPRSSSQRLTDHIRDVLNDPERQRERQRLKAGGSHDAKDVPEDSPAAVSYPRQPWERY